MAIVGILLALLFQELTFTPVKPDVVEQRLRQYKGDNKQREATLKALFETAGCKGDKLTEQAVKHVKEPNVICTLPGSTDSIIVVGAHFDRVKQSDGVVDNWSGASLLPSLFESMVTKERKHTFVFIGFTAEEEGEIGSTFYVRQLTKEQKTAIRAMVNMDTLGVSSTKVWQSRADKELSNLLGQLAGSMKSPLAGVNVENIGSTDSEQFRVAGIPAITIHSITQETWPILHNPRDQFSAIHLDDYYETYRLLAAYLTYLDAKL
jgi:Iap family predicted aminopeptidase